MAAGGGAATGEWRKLAVHAMRTRFELLLYGGDARQMEDAGEAALEEIRATDLQLSFFLPASWLSLLNREAGQRPVAVPPSLGEILLQCRDIHRESGGAFDPTVAPLLACWGLRGAPPRLSEIERARLAVGMEKVEVELDGGRAWVYFRHPELRLDLGGIGKGVALDRAAAALEERGVRRALLHGGTSTVLALDPAPGTAAWRIGVRDPRQPDQVLACVELRRRALSVSAPHGRSVVHDGRIIGHVLDPRSGQPAGGAELAVVTAASAGAADAWSTACLVQAGSRDERARGSLSTTIWRNVA